MPAMNSNGDVAFLGDPIMPRLALPILTSPDEIIPGKFYLEKSLDGKFTNLILVIAGPFKKDYQMGYIQFVDWPIKRNKSSKLYLAEYGLADMPEGEKAQYRLYMSSRTQLPVERMNLIKRKLKMQ